MLNDQAYVKYSRLRESLFFVVLTSEDLRSMKILNNASNVHIHGSTINAVEVTITGNQPERTYYADTSTREQAAKPQGFDLLYQYYSTNALFDSISHSDQPRCLKGTRVAIIKDILSQVEGKKRSGSICWLKGPVGTGKSALEYTVAAICKTKGLLIGGFAFSRTAINCGDGNTLIATLAIQLSRAIPEAKCLINSALKADPDIFERSREAQLRLLIIDPLRKIWGRAEPRDLFRRSWQYPTVIAIDGLDECSDRNIQCDIITSIGAVVQGLDFPLCFFISSRPEAHISHAFDTLQSDMEVRLSCMYLGEDATTSHDLQTYLEKKFQEIRKLHPYLPESWPSSKVISQLVEKASGQFIYVKTVMAFIMSVDARPEDCLKVILNLLKPPIGSNPYSLLDPLYSHILSSVKYPAATLQILGCLILPDVCDFRSPIVLEAVFGLQRGDVRRFMRDLLSVVCIDNDEQPIRVFHASRSHFLLDESRSRKHFVDSKRLLAILARKCLNCLTGFKSSSFELNNFKWIILPSVALCNKAGLLSELIDIIGHLDIPSAFRSLVYSSPTQYIIMRDPIEQLQRLLDNKVPVWDNFFWSSHLYEFQETRDKESASAKDIFVILTGQWRHIILSVSHLTNKKVVLPNLPIAGQVRCTSPRAGDDPAIYLVLVPMRPGLPDVVARQLDKRLLDSEYGVKSVDVYRRYKVRDWESWQELEWFRVWTDAQILN